MAEAAQQHQEEEKEQEQEQEQQLNTVEETDADEGSEEPKESMQAAPTRPLLSTRSMSSVDPDDDSPNMIVYRKVRTKNELDVFELVVLLRVQREPDSNLCSW